MNFRRGLRREEPEINFIPLIDVLLVILIFLMVSTTYTKYSELQVNLPAVTGEPSSERPVELLVGVAADGRYSIDKRAVPFSSPSSFAQELQRVAAGKKDLIVIIHADAGATHQAVVNVLESARLAGLPKVTFAAQSGAAASR